MPTKLFLVPWLKIGIDEDTDLSDEIQHGCCAGTARTICATPRC
jgi:hypothetical protein